MISSTEVGSSSLFTMTIVSNVESCTYIMTIISSIASHLEL